MTLIRLANALIRLKTPATTTGAAVNVGAVGATWL